MRGVNKMPRIEFENLEKAEPWIKTVILKSDKNYIGYHTLNLELILVPTKSTQPIVYGYIKHAEKDKIKKLLVGMLVFDITKFEWNAERGLPMGE